MVYNLKKRLKQLVQILVIFASVFSWFVQPSFSAATIYFDLVIDESRKLLYGSDRAGGCVDVISMDTLEIVNTIAVGSEPAGLDISPDGNELAVALYGQSEIALIDLETLEVSGSLVPTLTIGPNRPYDVIYGRQGRLYSVGNPGSSGIDYVHTFDTVNKIEVGKSFAIMRAAPRLAKTADNNTLYVSEVIFYPNKIYRFDISTDTPVQTASGPHGPMNVNTLAVKPDASRVYSSRGQVWSVDLASQLGSFSPVAEEIEYNDTLQRFFVTSGNRVYEFDANTYELVRLHILSWTGGVARVNAAGTFLYVSTDIGMEVRALDSTNCFLDEDQDGIGSTVVISDNGDGICNAINYESTVNTDCNDDDPDIFPGAVEIVGDGIDQDCDTQELCYKDQDSDSYGSNTTVVSANLACTDANESYVNTDCNDEDPTLHPGVAETWYDGIDSNCDGRNDYDADGDSWVSSSYNTEAGGTAPNTDDCNDDDATIHPGAWEIVADGIDQNCDGKELCYMDLDNDGWRPDLFSTVPSADMDCSDSTEAEYLDLVGDCNDLNANIFPGAVEIVGDGIDQDCNAQELCYKDQDNDSYGANTIIISNNLVCTDTNESNVNTDCNDDDATIHPGALEFCDGIDNNCNIEIDENDVCKEGSRFWLLVLPGILHGGANPK